MERKLDARLTSDAGLFAGQTLKHTACLVHGFIVGVNP